MNDLSLTDSNAVPVQMLETPPSDMEATNTLYSDTATNTLLGGSDVMETSPSPFAAPVDTQEEEFRPQFPDTDTVDEQKRPLMYGMAEREEQRRREKQARLMDVLRAGAMDEAGRKKAAELWGEDTLNRLELANEHDRAYMLGKRLEEAIGDGDWHVGHQVYKNANNLWGTDVISPDQIWKDFQGRHQKTLDSYNENLRMVRQEQEEISRRMVDCVAGKEGDRDACPADLLKYAENPQEVADSIMRARRAYAFAERRGFEDVWRSDALDMADLLTVNINGNEVLDQRALRLLMTAVDRRVQECQTDSTSFWRNLYGGFAETVRGSESLGVKVVQAVRDIPGMSGMEEWYSNNVAPLQGIKETFDGQRAVLDRYEQRRGALNAMQDVMHEFSQRMRGTSPDASWYVKTINGAGNITGQSLSYMAPGGWVLAMAGDMGHAGNAAARNGDSLVDVTINGLRNTVEEKGFEVFSVFGRMGAINKLLTKTGTGALARLAAKVPGRTFFAGTRTGKMLSAPAFAYVEEMGAEPLAGEVFEWTARKLSGLVGAEVKRKDFEVVRPVLQAMGDVEQSGGCALFVAAMAAGHAPRMKQEVAAFVMDSQRAQLAGYTKKHAEEMASFSTMEDKAALAQRYFESDVLKDPEGAAERARKAGAELADRKEARLYQMSGALDKVLEKASIGRIRKLEGTDRYEVSLLKGAEVNGARMEEDRSVEMSEEQTGALVQVVLQGAYLNGVRVMQDAILGNAAVSEAGKMDFIETLDMLSEEAPAEYRQAAAETGGMTVPGFMDMAARAQARIDAIAQEEGVSIQEARGRTDAQVMQRVELGSIADLAASFERRLDQAVRAGEITRMRAEEIRSGTTAASAAHRFTMAADPGSSLLLYAGGHARTANVMEDVQESALVHYMNLTGKDWQDLWGHLQGADAVLGRYGVSLGTYEGPAHDASDVVESFSNLSLSSSLADIESLPVPQWVKDTAEFALKNLEDSARIMRVGEQWNEFATTEEGRQFMKEHGDLADALQAVGASTESVFRQARMDASQRLDVEMVHADLASRRTPGDSTMTLGELEALEETMAQMDAEEDVKETAEEEAGTDPVTGIAGNPASPAPLVEDASGALEGLGEEAEHDEEAGAEFRDHAFVRVAPDCVFAQVRVDALALAPDVEQFKQGDHHERGAVKGRELQGRFREDAQPVSVWRRKDGVLHVITGRHRFDLAVRDGVEFIPAYVYQEDETHDATWAKMHDVGQNMLDGQASALEVAFFVMNSRMSRGEMEAQGYLRPGSANVMGLDIATLAGDEVFTRLKNGVITDYEAWKVCRLSGTEAGQMLAMQLREKGKPWDYVAAYVKEADRVAAEKSREGEAFDLFGNDTSWQEDCEKVARFTSRGIALITERLSLLKKSRGISRRKDLAGRLGIRLETDADLNTAINGLEAAKGAWQSHDPALRLDDRALAWDGTSEVNPFQHVPVSGATFSVVAMDSSGSVLEPETFVTREDGSPDWFVIPRRKGQPSMPVRLLVGSDVGEHRGYGLTHILASRGFSFWKDRSPERYISSILANVSELYEVAPGRELLVKGRQPSSWMLLQLDRQDGFYSIVSAYPVRQGKRPMGKKLPLAERQPANANSGTARLGPGSASKAALPSQSAGGRDGFSLPQWAKVVNVNEVECRFDDGSIVPATFSVVAMDSSGSVLEPETFVTREDGSPDWFVIPRRKGQPSMPVRLLVGSDVGEHRGYGLTHILASRGFSFWQDRSPERYISSILANVSELYEVAPGRELLVKGRQPSSWMLLQLDRQDGFYSILTAYPVEQNKKPRGRKLPLAERASDKSQTDARHRQPPANANSGTARLGPGSASKAALPSQSAGGGDGFSLPQWAKVVNVNEVECRFDDGSIVPATFSVVAMDSSGSVLEPETFVTRQDGSPDWFVIPRRKGQPSMPVRLLVGEDRGFHRGYGLTHIAASRDLDELWAKTTPERYISSIIFNASELYLAGDREILVKGKRPASWMVLQLEKEHGYYSILTAYPVENPKKKPKGERIPLAERTPEKITSQVKGKPVTLPANPIAAPGAFGALQNKTASASSSAGGEYALSLSPGARVVNINDVRLHFDDGSIVPATFSVVSVPAGDVVSTAAEMRASLKPLQGHVFVNKNTGIQVVVEARVSGKTVGKAQQAQMSIANLKALGFSAEEARKIHYTAATRIHELFENAEDAHFEKAYKDDPSRAGAYHFFNAVEIEGLGNFDVNVTALALKNEDQKLLYTLELTIETPKGVSVAYPKPDDQGDAYSASGVSTRKLFSYRSFVEKKKLAIKQQAVADGSFMKAPNGADSNLTEDQWLTVRTEAFKQWFGDWEKVARFKAAVEKIMTMEPVAAISGQEFQRDGVPLTEKVTRFWKEHFNSVAFSPELGEVRLDLEGVKSSIGHGIGSLKSAAFFCVEDVIRNGVVFDRQANWKGRGYDTAVIAAPVTIKDVDYVCEVVVEQRSNRQGFYLHEVEIKKKLEDVFKTSTEGGTSQASRSILALRAEDVKRDEENISQVVDENGEPLVVYHGSNSDGFTVFDSSKIETSWYSHGFYFSDKKSDAKSYGDNIFSVFLNIRNPFMISKKGWFEELPLEDKPKKPTLAVEAIATDAGMDSFTLQYKLEKNGEWFSPISMRMVSSLQLSNHTPLSLVNYFLSREYNNFLPRDVNPRVLQTAIKEAGHDGVIGEPSDFLHSGNEYVAYESTQIKSATDNRGTFDGGSPDITFSIAEAQEQGLFRDGHFEADHAVITEPGVTFSITALHASPHSFRKFVTDNMGGGEGNQAFGWGLYFAENKETNQAYMGKFSQSKDMLSASNYRVELNVDDSVLMDWDYVDEAILALLKDSTQEAVGNALEYAEERADYRGENVSGKGVYKALFDAFWDGGDDTRQDAQKGASLALLASGIRGIRYVDGVTRGKAKDEQTYNYVIFDGHDIKVTAFADASTNMEWKGYEDAAASFSLATEESIWITLEKEAQKTRLDVLRSQTAKTLETWRRVCAANDLKQGDGAEAFGRVMAVVASIYKTLPAGYRFSLYPYMRAAENLATRLEDGQAWLSEELKKETLMDDTSERMDAVIDKLLARTLVQADRYAIDQLRAEMVARIKAVQLTKKASGKFNKGKLSAEDYRHLHGIVAMMNTDLEAKEKRMLELEGVLSSNQSTDEEGDGAELELKDWHTFGHLAGMGLEQTRACVRALALFITTGRTAWSARLEEERRRTKFKAEKIVEGLGQATPQGGRDAEEDAKAATRTKVAKYLKYGLQSYSQMLNGWRKVPALRALAHAEVTAIAEANVALRNMKHARDREVTALVKRCFGVQRSKDVARVLSDFKKSGDSGVVLNPLVKVERTVRIAEAREWVGLSFEEREERRKAIKKEYNDRGLSDDKASVPEVLIPEMRRQLAELDELVKAGDGRARRRKNITAKAEVVRPGKKGETLRVSRAQAMYAILLYEQAEYVETMRNEGIGEAELARLREFVGADGLAFGYGLRELMNRQGRLLARVYEEREGVPFPAVENYFRAVFRADHKLDTKASFGEQTNAVSGGAKYGMLIPRRKHNLHLAWNMDCEAVFQAASAEVENYICTADITSRWRGILADKEAAAALKEHMGRHGFDSLRHWLDVIDGAGVMEGGALLAGAQATSRFQSAKAVALLSWNVLTMLKQTSGLMHGMFAGEVGMGSFLLHLGKTMSMTGRMGVFEMMKTEAFQARTNDAQAELVSQLMGYASDQNYTGAIRFSMAGMRAIEKMDVWSNAVSMAALYNAKWTELEEAGRRTDAPMTKDEMHALCMQSVTRALELVAQPLTQSQKSMLGTSTSLFVKMACFMSSEVPNKVGMIVSHVNAGNWGQALALYGVMSVAEQTVIALWHALHGKTPWQFIIQEYKIRPELFKGFLTELNS